MVPCNQLRTSNLPCDEVMAEALALTASVIAVIQLAERVASICKFYIAKVDDCPKDLRHIYVEVTTIKAVFEGLSFLDQDKHEEGAVLRALQGEDGPVEGCKRAMEELRKLFPPVPSASSPNRRSKKERLRMALNGLAWPLKSGTATRLLEEMTRYKTTISMALQGQIVSVSPLLSTL